MDRTPAKTFLRNFYNTILCYLATGQWKPILKFQKKESVSDGGKAAIGKENKQPTSALLADDRWREGELQMFRALIISDLRVLSVLAWYLFLLALSVFFLYFSIRLPYYMSI